MNGAPREGPLVLHVAAGKSAQGGVMAFVETVARLPVPGIVPGIWKHRDFVPANRGGDPDSGPRYVLEGVAEATDLGMAHDLRAGWREGIALRRWLRGRRDVLLHAHSRVGIIAACLAGAGGRRPVAVHLHKLSGQPWIYRLLVRVARGRWVFNSQRTREHHGIAPGAAAVIYPPVVWPSAPAPAPVSADSAGPRLVAAGAFVRVKQFDRLLSAVALLRRRGVSVPLVIYGRSEPPVDPACDAELVRQAAEVGGVELRAYDAAWAAGLRAGDVFVHAADLEAYGIVILEAFGRGCRVVVPPASVLGELGCRGDGVEVAESTEPSVLAGALERALAGEPDATTWWEGRRSWAGRVSAEECVCQLQALYRSLSGTRFSDASATD